MELSRKKECSAYVVLLFGTVLCIKSFYAETQTFQIAEKEEPAAALTAAADADGAAVERDPAEEIVFWYYGEENKGFFESCAEEFQKETGIAVNVKEQQSLNYFSQIYDAVKTGEEMPDGYLLLAEQLEWPCYCQLAANLDCKLPEDCAKTAAASCYLEEGGMMYGYPLYFDTNLFAYRTDYFETAPGSIQEIIDYSLEHEPGEGVEKLLEWDLSDPEFNYSFLGNGISFTKEEGCIDAAYQEEKFNDCKEFFANLTAVIELNETELSSRKVAEDFKKGKTVAVLLPSYELKNMEKNCNVELMPELKEDLPMCSLSETAVICVNDMSEKKQEVEEFAQYLTGISSQEKLSSMTGHLPVVKSALQGEFEEAAFLQYENGEAKPVGLNTTDFWVKFQTQALKIWHDGE